MCRHLEITDSTWQRWRKQYGAIIRRDEGRRRQGLKELRRENQRLKKIVADQVLDIDMLKELNRVTSDPGLQPAGRRRPPRPVRGLRAPGLCRRHGRRFRILFEGCGLDYY